MPHEDNSHVRKFGKWSEPGVPHRGWYCSSEFDAIEEVGYLLTCEMCERTEVRFVHVMQHSEYPVSLNCGCICAMHLSGEKIETEEREKRLRSRASRRTKFGSRKGWKLSARGNPNIRVGNMHVVVAQSRSGQFHIGSKRATEERFEWDARGYATQDEAKTGSFDLLERLGSI